MERTGQLRQHTSILLTDLGLLVLLALGRLALHMLTNHQYGFHRDELAFIDDARRLAWGYVPYPPMTPFIGRVALELFGPSLVGVRFFSALAQSAVMVLAGLMARELGGQRWAQVVAALGVAISPISLIQGAVFQYVSFDFLWWVLIAYLLLRLLNSQNPRWWLAIGAVVGLGLMNKYTIAFLIAGLGVGLLLTRERRWLASPWLWGGAAVALLIFAPNLVWLAQHNFISLEFLASIHERDVAIGRTEGYLVEQFYVAANPFTIPLWVAGLAFYLVNPGGARWRMLGWMYVTAFLLLLVMQGRSYYLAPAYPMLIAAGAAWWERRVAAQPPVRARVSRWLTWGLLALGGLSFIPVMLPVAPINSPLWHVTSELHDNFTEEIGWEELVEQVAAIYHALPEGEQPRAGIFTGNYGEAGAVNLYGPEFGLPGAISGINSYWLRGYGSTPPETLIVLGFSREVAEEIFTHCEFAGPVTNRYGVENEETTEYPGIFICREPRRPWPELWPLLKSFG